MNILLKSVICFLVGVVAFAFTLCLEYPLMGMREAHWVNFGFEMILLWGVALLIWAAILVPAVSDWTGVSIGNWIRGGGFWRVLSKSNIPGNTWVVLALVLIISAITYGPPTPQVDWEQVEQGIKALVTDSTHDSVSSVGQVINYLSKGIIGVEPIQQNDSRIKEDKLLPRYERGWWRILVALVVTVIALPVWLWGRRDEIHEKVFGFADWLKPRKESSGSASTDSSSGTLDGAFSRGKQIADHFIGESIFEIFENILRWFANLMKKF